jgi:CheY-like chemotaxis protein
VSTAQSGSIQTIRPGTVLLVDDDPIVLQLESLIFRQANFHVLEADGPKEALRLAASNATIDLLVTDFAMPGMNGLELTREVRKLHPNVPVLVVSGSIEACCGPDDYPERFALLPKPFYCDDLLKQAAALLKPASRPALA